MPYGDPINTLAQWRIWQIEIRALGTLLAAVLVGLWILVYCVFGESVAYAFTWVIVAVPVFLIVLGVVLLFRAIFIGPSSNIDFERFRANVFKE